jgi:hypothetical protein
MAIADMFHAKPFELDSPEPTAPAWTLENAARRRTAANASPPTNKEHPSNLTRLAIVPGRMLPLPARARVTADTITLDWATSRQVVH